MAIAIGLTSFTANLNTNVANVVDATTGYVTRSSFGVLTYAYKCDYTGAQTPYPTVGNNGNPQSDTEWTFTYSTDGWVQVYMVVAPVYSSGTTYNQYDCVYDPISKLIYTSIAGSNTGHTPSSSPTYWVVSTVPGVVNSIGTSNQSNNLNNTTGAAGVINTIMWAITTFNYDNYCAVASLESCMDCKRTWDVTRVQFLRMMLDGLIIASQRQDYTNGEKICRRAISLAQLTTF